LLARFFGYPEGAAEMTKKTTGPGHSRERAGVESAPSGRETELGRWEPVSDALVLAAVERAERHRQREGVVRSDIAAHLGFVRARVVDDAEAAPAA
jgi:hypothetical protein